MFSNDDLTVIKISFEEKGWRGKRIAQEYPRNNWSRQSINRVINKLIERVALLAILEVVVQQLQQDSAPQHRCRLAQHFLQANTPDFIHIDA